MRTDLVFGDHNAVFFMSVSCETFPFLRVTPGNLNKKSPCSTSQKYRGHGQGWLPDSCNRIADIFISIPHRPHLGE